MKSSLRRVSLGEMQDRIRHEKNLVVLCGAGVSMVAPTLLPSGNTLRDDCVSHLLTDQFSARFVKRLVRSRAYQSLLPEAVLQDLSSVLGSAVDEFISSKLQCARSNEIHGFVARNRNKIFTTNFDLCFEQAGARIVNHLHGSINDPPSLQYRAFRLGKTSRPERNRFRRALSGSVLLVLGYSLRDSDILEIIREYPPKELLYLSFDGFVPVSAKTIPGRFTVAEGSAEALFCVPITQHPWMSDSRKNVTPRLIPSIQERAAALIKICGRAAEYRMAVSIMKVYEPILRGKFRLVAMCELANILRIAGKCEKAKQLAIKALESRSARDSRNSIWVSTAHIVIGLSELERNGVDYDDVERHFRIGLRIFDHFVAGTRGSEFVAHDQIWRARIFNNLGLLYAQRRNHKKSLTFYKRSCAIKKRHHDD